MRTLVILLSGLLISLLSYGQGRYKSFIHSGVTKWLYYSPQDGCMMDEVDSFGDTVINQDYPTNSDYETLKEIAKYK